MIFIATVAVEYVGNYSFGSDKTMPASKMAASAFLW